MDECFYKNKKGPIGWNLGLPLWYKLVLDFGWMILYVQHSSLISIVARVRPSKAELRALSDLQSVTLYCTALHCTSLHCTTLFYTALHFPAMHCAELHSNGLNCTLLHCTEL